MFLPNLISSHEEIHVGIGLRDKLLRQIGLNVAHSLLSKETLP